MRLLRDIAVDLLREAMPGVPGPVQETIDDLRETSSNVALVRYRLSKRGVEDLQDSYAGGVRKIRRVEQAAKILRAARRRV